MSAEFSSYIIALYRLETVDEDRHPYKLRAAYRTMEADEPKGNILIAPKGFFPTYSGLPKIRRRLAPSLLQVDRQIRVEAAATYYRINRVTFHVHDMDFTDYYNTLETLRHHTRLFTYVRVQLAGHDTTINFSKHAEIEDKYFSKSCFRWWRGDETLWYYYDHGMKIVELLRKRGLKWADVHEVCRNIEGIERTRAMSEDERDRIIPEPVCLDSDGAWSIVGDSDDDEFYEVPARILGD